MLIKIPKLFQKKCAHCKSILPKDGRKKANLDQFKEINTSVKIENYSRIQLFICEVTLCEKCFFLLEDTLERKCERRKLEQQNKRLLEQEKAEMEYQERLKRKVDLKILERQAVELDINYKELKKGFPQ